MNLKDIIAKMGLDEVEKRLAEISNEIEKRSGAELEQAKEEVALLNERKEAIEAETRAQVAAQINAGQVQGAKVVETRMAQPSAPKTVEEIRSSLEYGKAFLRGIKTDNYAECRKLMTTGASVGLDDSVSTATVPVPTSLDNEIRNAWEQHEILGLVKKTYLKGIVKVVFEVSATGATIHLEGADRPEEEKIVLGTVELTPANIKKWITVSDEAIEGTTIDTIGYLYKEIAQKIAAKAEEEIIKNITTAQVATDVNHPGVAVVSQNPDVDTILNAVAALSAKARNLYLVMNRQTYPAFVKLALKAGYAIDVFDGLKDKIKYTDQLPSFSAALVGDVYYIVGDFGYGYQANFPNGNDITIKRDDISLAEFDLVKLVGKQYVGHGVVAPKAFTLGKKVDEG